MKNAPLDRLALKIIHEVRRSEVMSPCVYNAHALLGPRWEQKHLFADPHAEAALQG